MIELEETEQEVEARKVLEQVFAELRETWRVYPRPMNSTHEGWAVMYEEVDEMWDAIKYNDPESARSEAVQVAAMAIRFIVESRELR